MTIIEFVLIIISVLIMLVGLILFIRGMKSNHVGDFAQQKLPEGVQYKDGLPVLPRQMRQFEEPTLESESEPDTGLDTEQTLQQSTQSIVDNNTDAKNIEIADDDITNTSITNTAVDKFDETYHEVVTPAISNDELNTNNAGYEPIYFPDVSTDSIEVETNKNEGLKSAAGAQPINNQVAINTVNDTHQTNAHIESYIDTKASFESATVSQATDINQDADLELQTNHSGNTSAKQANRLIEDIDSSDSDNKDSYNPDNAQALEAALTQDDELTQNSPLHNAEFNLNISILPNNEFAKISGKQLLKLADNYGFKFGEMDMFHRYQEKDGSGILWFSMMGLGLEGVKPFDVNTLANDEFKGVILFLPLPHPKVFQGFDSMMSIASLMARELDGHIVDEHNVPINTNYKKKLRKQLEAVYGE